MSKSALFHNLSENGVNYGRKMRAEDITRLQNYAHQHIETFVADIVAKATRTVAGFNFTKPSGAGNDRKVEIGLGRVYDQNGLQFALTAASLVTIEAAETTLGSNRLDIVAVKLEPGVEIENAPVPVQRIRTQAQLESNVQPYVPTELPAAQTKVNRATVVVKKGTPGATPTLPALAADEVALYVVNVPGGSTSVRADDMVDSRKTFRTQVEQDEFMNKLREDLEALIERIIRLETIDQLPVDLTGVYKDIRSLGDILREFRFQIATLGVVNPEIVRPGLLLSDPSNGKLDAVGGVDNGKPCVDIELGARVRFAASEHPVTPGAFLDATRNARIVNTGGGAASASLETALTLPNVTEIDSNGNSTFVKRNAEFPTGRYAPAICSRGAGTNQAQYIEIFGGAHAGTGPGLSDWKTYDVVNDTLTNRTMTGATPPIQLTSPSAFPYGNGFVLLGSPNQFNGSVPGGQRWFRLNAETGACVELSGTTPDGIYFIGDKITHDKIFIIALQNGNAATATQWLYDINTHSFTQLAVAGNVPLCPTGYANGCFFQMGEFVLVEFPDASNSNGVTYLFELATLTWRKLNIASPRPVVYFERPEDDKRQIAWYKMANVAGRVLMVGATARFNPDYLTTNSVIWELKVANYLSGEQAVQNGWRFTMAQGYQPLLDQGFCTTYHPAFKSGRQSPLIDRGVSVCGSNLYGVPTKHIYSTVLGGLIGTTLDGVSGITLADTATFAEFIVPIHTANWDVAQYFASLRGKFDPGQIEMHVSFDDGVTFHAVTHEKTLTVTDSLAPGKRHLRVVMRAYTYTNGVTTGGNRPVLTGLKEIFDQDGLLGGRSKLRFDVVANESVKAVYMDSAGKITLSTTVEPSTPDRCLLQKITPGSGVVAPGVKNYVNRRRAIVRHRKLKVNGNALSGQFDNDLGVTPIFSRAVRIKAGTGVIHDMADPSPAFDALVTLSDAVDGDEWEVEVEG